MSFTSYTSVPLRRGPVSVLTIAVDYTASYNDISVCRNLKGLIITTILHSLRITLEQIDFRNVVKVNENNYPFSLSVPFDKMEISISDLRALLNSLSAIIYNSGKNNDMDIHHILLKFDYDGDGRKVLCQDFRYI